MTHIEIYSWFWANFPRILILICMLSSCLWLFCEIRSKRFLCLFFGLLTIISLAGYGFLGIHVRSFYDNDANNEVLKCAAKVLEKGETNTVIDAFTTFLKDLENPEGYTDKVYYEARNKMWLRLHKAAGGHENMQADNVRSGLSTNGIEGK